MQNKKSFHKKRKNIGLVYNVVVQEMTKNILESSQDKFLESYNIIKRNFKEDSELYKELQFYNIFCEAKTHTLESAGKIYKKTIKFSDTVNSKKLERELEKLLEFINRYNKKYNIDLLNNIKINNYKEYATTQQLLEYNRNKEKYIRSIPQIVELEKMLIESIVARSNSNKSQKLYETFTSVNQEIDDTTMNILINRFNKKYKNMLSVQKEALNYYILSLGGNEKLKKYLKEEYIRLYKRFISTKRTISDKPTKVKITGITNIIKEVIIDKKKLYSENSVSLILGLQQLEENIKKLVREEVAGSSVFYDTLKGNTKSMIIIDSGSKINPEEITVGMKFFVKFKKTDRVEHEKEAYEDFMEQLKKFISNDFYKELSRVFSSHNFKYDNFPANYPTAALQFVGNLNKPSLSHYKTIMKFGKKLEGYIEWPVETDGSIPIEDLRKIINKTLLKTISRGVFNPKNDDPWDIV